MPTRNRSVPLWSLLAASLLLACASLALIPSPSWSAPPANDEIADATRIGDLPFSDTSDVREATLSAGETACDGQETQQTVWYTFTFADDRRIVLDRRRSDYESYLGIYTGTPGSLDQAFCSFYRSPVSVFEAKGGVTYYLQIGAWPPVPGYPAQSLGLDVYDVPIPPVKVSAAVTRATLDHDGDVQLSGYVRCNHEAYSTIRGSLTQVHHRGEVSGEFSAAAPCSATSTRWHATVEPTPRRLVRVRPVYVHLTASACDEWGCDAFEHRRWVWLRLEH
jgi:hypothetical protein